MLLVHTVLHLLIAFLFEMFKLLLLVLDAAFFEVAAGFVPIFIDDLFTGGRVQAMPFLQESIMRVLFLLQAVERATRIVVRFGAAA